MKHFHRPVRFEHHQEANEGSPDARAAVARSGSCLNEAEPEVLSLIKSAALPELDGNLLHWHKATIQKLMVLPCGDDRLEFILDAEVTFAAASDWLDSFVRFKLLLHFGLH